MISDSRPFEAYYDSSKKCFWIQNERGLWIEIGLDMLRLKLKEAGLSIKKADKRKPNLTEVEAYVVDLITAWDVAYAGPLAGYMAGMIEQNGNRILVTTEPSLIPPERGEWPLMKEFLKNLLGEEQTVYFFGWLQHALRGLYEGRHTKGQCLVIAGPSDCGKSLLQNRLTAILGGRASKPFLFMTGGTSFNREQLGSEHLQIEDEASKADAASRKSLGSFVKGFVVNELQLCHGKNREGINLMPRLRRLTMTANDDPEDLVVIPPLRDSLVDKFMLLKAGDGKIPKDSDTFVFLLERELPFFINFLLNEFELPEKLQSRRFGVTHYHNPELIAAINDMEPEAEVYFYITSYLFLNGVSVWTGSPKEFLDTLAMHVGEAAARLLGNPTRTGKLLKRLAKLHPGMFVSGKGTKGARFWTIKKPADDVEIGIPLDNLGGTSSNGRHVEMEVPPMQLLDNKDVV